MFRFGFFKQLKNNYGRNKKLKKHKTFLHLYCLTNETHKNVFILLSHQLNLLLLCMRQYLMKIQKGFADRKTLRLFKDINLNFKDETTNDYVAWKYLDK